MHISSPFRMYVALPIVFSALCCLFASCGESRESASPNAGRGSSAVIMDSIRRKEIDTLVQQMRSVMRQTGNLTRISYPKYYPTDSIDVQLLPDRRAAIISSEFHTMDSLFWPTYVFHEGDLIQVRYRKWERNPPDTTATEVIVYLDRDKIVYAAERGMILSGGLRPASLLLQPHAPSNRPEQELRNLYEPLWPDIRNALRQSGIDVAHFTKQ